MRSAIVLAVLLTGCATPSSLIEQADSVGDDIRAETAAANEQKLIAARDVMCGNVYLGTLVKLYPTREAALAYAQFCGIRLPWVREVEP